MLTGAQWVILAGTSNYPRTYPLLLPVFRHAIFYLTSQIKRYRATKAEVELRRARLFEIISVMRPMTVRQVFYQAAIRNLVEKSEAGYDKVQADTVRMRRVAKLPYDWLTDNTRWQRKPRTLNGVEEALRETARLYRKSLWSDATI